MPGRDKMEWDLDGNGGGGSHWARSLSLWTEIRDGDLTFFFTCMHVNEIVPRPVMRDPLHAGREPHHEFAIIYPDTSCGDVAPVDPDGTLVWPTGLEAGKELGTVGRIVYLDRCP